MTLKRDKAISTEGAEPPEGNTTDVDKSYKYHGVPQANSNQDRSQKSQPQPSTLKDQGRS